MAGVAGPLPPHALALLAALLFEAIFLVGLEVSFPLVALWVYYDWPCSYSLWVFPLAFWEQADQRAPVVVCVVYLGLGAVPLELQLMVQQPVQLLLHSSLLPSWPDLTYSRLHTHTLCSLMEVYRLFLFSMKLQ